MSSVPDTPPIAAEIQTPDPVAALSHIYADYYGLSEHPFAITPDPRFLFMSQRHRDALAHLLFSVKQGGGFVQLTGEVGTGKTTLTRALLAQLPENVRAAIILNPKQSALEFVQSICDELSVPYDRDNISIKALTDALNVWLLAAHERGQRAMVLIDEAQNLEVGVLEQIRLLTNLETTKEKLLQIILVGQPELRLMLERRDLRQLAQRITARYHLLSLSERETGEMVRHRLAVAGFTQHLFDSGSLSLVHRASKGIPRLINVICDRALLGAYAENRRVIDRRIVLRAAAEVFGEEEVQRLSRRARTVAIALGAIVLLVAAGILWRVLASSPVSSVSTPAPALEPPPPVTQPEPAPASTPPPAAATTPTKTSAPVNAPPDFAEAINDPGLRTDLDSAMTTLLGLWKTDLATVGGDSPCARAQSVGLTCFTSNAKLKPMLALNHAVILKLANQRGAEHFAVLKSANAGQLSLLVNTQEFTIPESGLEPHWRGDYILLWKKPLAGIATIRPGMTGAGVRWMRDVVTQLDGKSNTFEIPMFYDEELVLRVKALQNKLGMPADGIVGERTMIRLIGTLAEPPLPALRPRA